MARLVEWLDTWWARLAAGLAAMAALSVLLRPGPDWALEWEPLLAFVSAFGLWVISTLRSATSPTHPSDARLYAEIEETIGHDERQFIRQHDFLNEFLRNRLDGTRRVYSDWDGPRYRFIDKKVQAAWLTARSALDAFFLLVVRDTAPARGRLDFQTVRTSRGDDVTDQERGEARALNEAANSLTKAFDAYEALSRRRLLL